MAALWIASAAFASGSLRPARVAIGAPLSVWLAAYSTGAPWLPAWALYPAFVLIIVWFVIVGATLRPGNGPMSSTLAAAT